VKLLAVVPPAQVIITQLVRKLGIVRFGKVTKLKIRGKEYLHRKYSATTHAFPPSGGYKQ
jgi:hypothetical protein